MTGRRPDPVSEVDALYRDLPDSYRAVAEALRETVQDAAPRLRETVKWNNPFWVGRKDVLCLQCFPDHVNLGVLRGAGLARRFPRLEGTGKGMRHLKVRSVSEARSPAVRNLVRAAVKADSDS